MTDVIVIVPSNVIDNNEESSCNSSTKCRTTSEAQTLLLAASALTSLAECPSSTLESPFSASAKESSCSDNETDCVDKILNIEDEKKLDDTKTSENDEPMTFPQKLMEILSNEEHSDIIAWLPHGFGFNIHHKKKFAAEVLPRYLRQTKYTSFTRKLNRWGFTRVSNGVDTGAYYHKFFRRGNLRLCLKMSCLSVRTQFADSFSTKKHQSSSQDMAHEPSGANLPFDFSLESLKAITYAREMNKKVLRIQCFTQLKNYGSLRNSMMPSTPHYNQRQEAGMNLPAVADVPVHTLQCNKTDASVESRLSGCAKLPLTQAIAFQERVKTLAQKQLLMTSQHHGNSNLWKKGYAA